MNTMTDTLAITGSFEHNGKTYTYQAEARPREPQGRCKGAVVPKGSLLRKLWDESPMCYDDCRAAINTIADWLERESDGHLGSVKHFAKRMRMEAGE